MCHLYNNMLRTVRLLRSVGFILINTGAQGIQFLRLAVSSRSALSAEVLFLRKQLAFYQEQIPPRKLTDAARFSLVLWSRLFNWREALIIVKPETLIGWHGKGFKVFWRWKSRMGRPRIPENLAGWVFDVRLGRDRVSNAIVRCLGLRGRHK